MKGKYIASNADMTNYINLVSVQLRPCTGILLFLFRVRTGAPRRRNSSHNLYSQCTHLCHCNSYRLFVRTWLFVQANPLLLCYQKVVM